MAKLLSETAEDKTLSDFADFWNHICLNCGQTVKRIHRHHVSYFPEFTVQLCGSCHYGLTQWPEEQKSYLIRYTRDEYREFYNLSVRGLKDSALRRARFFFNRGLSVSKSKDRPTVAGMSNEVMSRVSEFVHLIEMQMKILSVRPDMHYGDRDDPFRFYYYALFRLGEDEFFESDKAHMRRYGVPVVTLYYSPVTRQARLEWTKPGHFGYSSSFEIWEFANPLLIAAASVVGEDRFVQVRGLIPDLEASHL